MSEAPMRVLAIGAEAAAQVRAMQPLLPALTLTEAVDTADAAAHDAVLIVAPGPAALAAWAGRPELAQAAFASAVLVVASAATQAGHEAAEAALEDSLLRLGVEAVVGPAPTLEQLARALRHAVLRKQVERSARHAYATDLATGLPHEAQLLEHMTQLLALRERQPSPMAVIALQIEGYGPAAASLGEEAANVLRRKVAVRLRSGLRASDVVASMGPDQFGVLLGHIDALDNGDRVASKLVRLLQQPFQVAGQVCPVAARVGVALYPVHGKDGRELLQRASAQAGSVATMGSAGVATRLGDSAAFGTRLAAANDEPPAAPVPPSTPS